MSIAPLRTTAVVAVVLIAQTACEMPGVGSGIPDVAGSYTGPVVFQFSGRDLDVAAIVTLVVKQDGTTLTIGGTLREDRTWSIPEFTGTVSKTGYVAVTDNGISGTFRTARCGSFRSVSISLTFLADGLVRLAETASAQFCGAFTVAGTLSK